MANQRVDRRQILQGVGALGALGALAALQSPTRARADDEQEEHEEHERSLIGSWEFTATISPGASLNRGLSLVAPGGVALFTDQGEPSQHVGLGVGAWIRTGKRTFDLTFVRQRFDANGTLLGTVKIRETRMLHADGDTFGGSGSFGVLDLTGTVVSSGSFTIQGTRIAVQAVGGAATPTGTAGGTPNQ
jgi:hypothetical protein